MSHVHRLVLSLSFPEGLHPGAGKDLSNRLVISRDGLERPVLRGSALAGALRQAYTDSGGATAERHFGEQCSGVDAGLPSRLRVADMVLDVGKGVDTIRHHNGIDRHSGAVRAGSLFDVESLPPGSSGTAVLAYHDPEPSDGHARHFLETLSGRLANGMTLGGKAARGIGRVVLSGDALYRCFDLGDLKQHADWLDEQYAWCGGVVPQGGEPLAFTRSGGDDDLVVDLVLAIPPGQDLLVADGQGVAYEMEPQRSVNADGNAYWRLPGSSLRGVLRGWISRLAAREGLTVNGAACEVDDRVQRYLDGQRGTGEQIAWGFDNAARDPKAVPPCPVIELFGSAARKGRIHISDGFCEVQTAHEQVRMHVAVDGITGGASEGFLFDNTVLCGAVAFPVSIRLHRPTEREARWLAQSLKALDMGLLRVGSSKAVGVLKIESLRAYGQFEKHFETIGEQESAV